MALFKSNTAEEHGGIKRVKVLGVARDNNINALLYGLLIEYEDGFRKVTEKYGNVVNKLVDYIEF